MLPCAAAPAAFSFLRIAHTSQAIPGGTGNFTGFDPEVSTVYPAVPFRGFGAGGQEGIYTGNGAHITRLADRTTPAPGTSGRFDAFGSPSGTGPVVVQASGAGRTGIYRISTHGVVQVVEDAPVGSAVFGRAAGSGANVAYRRDNVIMSNRTGTLGPVSFAVGNVAIQSVGDPDIATQGFFGALPIGVRVDYTEAGLPPSGVLTSGAGPNDEILFPAPGFVTNEASVNWSGVVTVNQAGTAVRYRSTFIPPDQQVLVGHPIPGGTGGFTGFRGVSAGSPNLGPRDTEVIFLGLGGGGQEGVYAVGHLGGGVGFPQVTKVIARGDVLDGRIVESLALGRDAENGVSVALHATFTDGSSGIYFTILPEPTIAALMGAIPILLARRRHRRRD